MPKSEVDAEVRSGCRGQKWMLIDPEEIMTKWSVNTINFHEYMYIILFTIQFIAV